VLRHRTLIAMAIYAKVDRVALRALARPWPEARPGAAVDHPDAGPLAAVEGCYLTMFENGSVVPFVATGCAATKKGTKLVPEWVKPM
jgi:hypothetical protein